MRRALLLLVLSAGLASAAPIERDLGQGLVFCRIHVLPGDLPTGESLRLHPCVLDLRYVQGDAAGATALAAWLKFHSSPRTPVLLLANPETAAALLAPFASADSLAGLVIVGRQASDFSPDIAVAVSRRAERRAYDALEKGAPIDSLVVETVDKPRNDEALLAREHLPDSALADTPDPAPAEGRRADRRPAPPVDAVLQRAVQLHRALVALRRIGPG